MAETRSSPRPTHLDSHYDPSRTHDDSDPLASAISQAERSADGNMVHLLHEISLQYERQINALKADVAAARKAEFLARQKETEAVQSMQLKDKAAKAKNMFMANVSHELRTPLNGMIGMSELLKQTDMNEVQSEYVDSIRVCGDTLLQVINDILDFSKIEAGKLRMFNVAFSLKEAVPEVVRAVRCTQPADGQVRTVEKLNLPSQMVYGDNVRLHQIFMNLLSNSYKFTQEGTVTVNGKIDREDSDSVTVTCSVEDTGIGISDEHIKRLFRPFSQAEDSTGRRFGGSGLGLSICKSLIEMMGGQIWIESSEGYGTTVSFSLTYPKASIDTQASVSDVSTPSAEPLSAFPQVLDFENLEAQGGAVDLSRVPHDQIRICVAEDNPINQKVTVGFVEKLGYGVEAFDDGEKTIEALRSKAREGNPYHVVLMDVQMPILNGYKATEAIRADDNPVIRNVLIIAMTASAIEGDREKCIDAGMNDYLAKPVRHAALSDKLSKYLSSRTSKTPKPVAPSSPYFPPSHSRFEPPLSPSPSSPSSARTVTTSNQPDYVPESSDTITGAVPLTRPQPNRASTGSQLLPRGYPDRSAPGLAENVQPPQQPYRPRVIPRRTASGRVETLKSLAKN